MKYFKPEQTADKRNYYAHRKNGAGRVERYQLPQEGLYTETEMAKIVGTVPGEWVDIDPRDTAFIFGLRQHCPRAVITLKRMPREVGAPRNSKPGYRWTSGYIVNGEYPPVGRNEAYKRAREIGGAKCKIQIED